MCDRKRHQRIRKELQEVARLIPGIAYEFRRTHSGRYHTLRQMSNEAPLGMAKSGVADAGASPEGPAVGDSEEGDSEGVEAAAGQPGTAVDGGAAVDEIGPVESGDARDAVSAPASRRKPKRTKKIRKT